MLDVTVKTLDSNTRDFSVEENITVKEFKEKIAGSVNIPATTQRLIFRGRVLKDDKKLSEYQCHSQVIHLVEKPPPTSTAGGSSTRSTTSRSDGQNNFFLGAVHLPAEVTDPSEIQQTVQQILSGMGDVGRNARVTSRSSADGSSVDVHINLGTIGSVQTPLTPAQLRINQIRNMLRQANTAISTLEANLRGNSGSATVPSSVNNNYPTTSASTTTGQTQSRSSTTSAHQADSTSSSSSQSGSGPARPANNAPSTASGSTSQTEPQGSNQQGTQTSSSQTASQNPRATELAEVMSELFSLERRLRPHMDRYHTLLVDQPIYGGGSEDLRRARATQNVCCQVMHYISHIYHSLSDFNVCMLSRPPRVATVPGMPPPINRIPVSFLGSPIPMSRAETGGPTNQPSSTSTNPSQAAASPGTAPTTGAPPTTGPTAPRGPQPQAAQPNASRAQTGATRPQMGASRPHIHPMGPRPMPPFGTRGMRPQGVRFTMPADGSGRTFHIRGPQIEIHQMLPNAGGGQQGATPLTPHMMQNIAQVIMQQIQQLVGRPSPGSPTPGGTEGSPDGQPQSGNGQPQTTAPEQTSTSSSSSSTPGASDSPSAGSVPRTVRVQVTQHGPVGQPGGPSVRVRLPAGVRVQTAVRPGNNPPPTTTTSASQRQQTTSTPVGGTNSTTSTNTASQSNPRPIPSMNPLVVGMWDPFLPCHSRHRNAPGANNRPEGSRNPRQAGAPRQTAQQQQRQRQQPQMSPGPSIPGMPDVAEMITGVMNALSGSTVGSTAGPSTSQRTPPPDLLQMFSHMNSRSAAPDNPQTLEQLFSGFTSVGEQHGFLNEMAGALSRDLRVNDLSQVMAGNPAPLGRIRPTIVEFINTRILQGAAPTPTNIRTSARRILTESRGEFREMLGNQPTLHDIDALATYCYFFEEVLVDILTISVGDNAVTGAEYGDRLVDLLQQSIHAGIQMTMYIYGGEAPMRTFIFHRLRAWSSSLGIPGGEMLGVMSAGHVNRIVDNMRVTEAEIMRYIIKNGEGPPDTPAPASLIVQATGETGSSTSSDTMETATESSFEAMEVDSRPPMAAGSSSAANGSGLPTGWEAVVPPSWVPVMTQDIQRQRRQAPQGPFSNAYLHGLPPKRMKLAQDRPGRPTEGTSSFIRETLRRAVENSGVQPRTGMDSLLEEAEGNTAIHSACDEQMKSALKQRMRSDPDYDPQKFPNTDKYLQK